MGYIPFYVRSKKVLKSDKYLFDDEAIIIPGEGGVGDVFHYIMVSTICIKEHIGLNLFLQK